MEDSPLSLENVFRLRSAGFDAIKRHTAGRSLAALLNAGGRE